MGCNCHSGHPPCSYCEKSFECEKCQIVFGPDESEMMDGPNNKIYCENCLAEHEEEKNVNSKINH